MSDNYKTIKVYGIENTHDAYTGIYTCRGVACDILKSWGYYDRKKHSVVESSVLYQADSGVKDVSDLAGKTVYRCLDGGVLTSTGKKTPWFLTEEEAQNAAKEREFRPIEGLGCYSEQSAQVHTDTMDPLPKTFITTFQRAEDGRLFTRINAHPELNGKTHLGPGKLFFPDHSFTLADVGEAKVSISKEFDKYGFLTGEMIRFDICSPDLKDVLDWAWDKGIAGDELVIINHPARGRYYAVSSDGGESFSALNKCLINNGTFSICKSSYNASIIKEDVEQYTEQRGTFMKFFVEDVWGTDANVNAICGVFQQSEFYEASAHEFGRRWEKSIKFHSAVIDKAVKDGVLSQYTLPALHIEVVAFNWDIFCSLKYSAAELKQLAEEVNAINKKADERAYELRRKGKFVW